MIFITLLGCESKRLYITPIPDFDLNKYMGKWYEIARLENRFQEGMVNVTANYMLKNNGVVKVVNRGYSLDKKKWKEAKARAKQTETPNHIKVSFFPLTSGDYCVLYIDKKYTTAIVSGGKTDYLWILSRTATLPKTKLKTLIEMAEQFGFDTSELIFTQT